MAIAMWLLYSSFRFLGTEDPARVSYQINWRFDVVFLLLLAFRPAKGNECYRDFSTVTTASRIKLDIQYNPAVRIQPESARENHD
jgi:hypothetical protein